MAAVRDNGGEMIKLGRVTGGTGTVRIKGIDF
jgi:hypothetical protein